MTAVQRYRKKPVEIDATQWDGSAEGATPIIDWMLDNDATARFHEAQTFIEGPDGQPQQSARLFIDTLEGTMYASPSDWIIRGVQGEFYPCKPDIFAATYEPVAAVSAPPEESQK